VSYRYILYEVQDRVAIITFNRPQKLNAWLGAMVEEIRDALVAANEDDGVGAIVATGAGRGFCAGADIIEEFKRRTDAIDAGQIDEEKERSAGINLGILRDPLHRGKPVIAAINGYAVGAGFTFALNCDIRIASEEAKLNSMFLRVGLVPEFGSTWLLPRVVGLAKACELVLMPRMLDAREALELGLVSKVVPADQLMPEAMAMANTIARGPSFAVRKAKEMLYRNLDASRDDAWRLEMETLVQCVLTPEHREGIQAFIERREPDFRRPEATDGAPE
jgi:2-(1,2-epoxy-1,2-dihydrophenyl)acetyl-CoA isomerase